MTSAGHDAIVVGSGPNGLAAAICLARARRRVLLLEAAETVGGGCRSAALTLPGLVHDVCSAIHPMAKASPFLRHLPLDEHGLEWVESPAPLAHPLEGGDCGLVRRSVDDTAEGLGEDGSAYRRLIGRPAGRWEGLERDLLGPFPWLPRHPLRLARFGLSALRSARALAESAFRGERARALFAGLAGHSVLPLETAASAAIGLVLGIQAHTVGWPFPRGGAQRLVDAMASYFRELGGEIRLGAPVESLAELPAAKVVLLAVAPGRLARLAGDGLPASYRRRLGRFRHGPGVFKLDLAVEGGIPWRSELCRQAATVHLGGTFDEIAAAESDAWQGRHSERPFVLLAQPGLFDASRTADGVHPIWAYCHVPAGSELDCTQAIEGQIERFAPGFRERIRARAPRTARQLEAYNPNLVGGDITGGVNDLRQLWTRPVARFVPYRTPAAGIYLCSSSTPPGGGVHGMCGYHAARAVLRRELR